MLEGVAILLAERLDELSDLRICIRNLDRVRLDVHDLISLLLQGILQVDHEQRTTLRYDIVLVAWVLECVRELSRRQPIDDVDGNLQRVG